MKVCLVLDLVLVSREVGKLVANFIRKKKMETRKPLNKRCREEG